MIPIDSSKGSWSQLDTFVYSFTGTLQKTIGPFMIGEIGHWVIDLQKGTLTKYDTQTEYGQLGECEIDIVEK